MDQSTELLIRHLCYDLGVGDDTQEILGYGIIKRNDGICKEAGYRIGVARGSMLEFVLDLNRKSLDSMVDGGMAGVTYEGMRAERMRGERVRTIKDGTKGPKAIGKRPVLDGVAILVGGCWMRTRLKGEGVCVGLRSCKGKTMELRGEEGFSKGMISVGVGGLAFPAHISGLCGGRHGERRLWRQTKEGCTAYLGKDPEIRKGEKYIGYIKGEYRSD